MLPSPTEQFLEALGVFLPRQCAHFMISLAFLCGAFLFERISLSQRAKTVPCCSRFPIFKETHHEIEICLDQNDHQSLKSYLSNASSAPIRQQLSNKLSQNGNIWEYIMVCLTASTIHPFIVSAQLSATPGVSHFRRHPQIAAIETICPWRPVRHVVAATSVCWPVPLEASPERQVKKHSSTPAAPKGVIHVSLDHKNIISIKILLAMFA